MNDPKSPTNYKTEVFTGIRPTGGLTVANYLGSVALIIEFQKQGLVPMIFVADLHGLTDREPSEIKGYVKEVVIDYLALGVDPKKAVIFIQSDITSQVFTMSAYLMRHISVAELIKLPTLKDKLKTSERPENANALLAAYPAIMAADILLQRSHYVPVGEDQIAHIEVTRKMARRFNERYGEVLPLPEPQKVKPLRLLGLKGSGKMSKTSPEQAVFLTDDPKVAEKKIKSAETAFAGEMNETLESHITVAKGLTEDQNKKLAIDEVIAAHMKGEKVMGKFKELFAQITVDFLGEFQTRRSKISSTPDYVISVLEAGKKIAATNADETLSLMHQAMYH